MTNALLADYAEEQLDELIRLLCVSLTPARRTLSDNIHLLVNNSPEDSRLRKHQLQWAGIQRRLLGKMKNHGS